MFILRIAKFLENIIITCLQCMTVDFSSYAFNRLFSIYIKIQLGSEAEKAQTKSIEWHV